MPTPARAIIVEKGGKEEGSKGIVPVSLLRAKVLAVKAQRSCPHRCPLLPVLSTPASTSGTLILAAEQDAKVNSCSAHHLIHLKPMCSGQQAFAYPSETQQVSRHTHNTCAVERYYSPNSLLKDTHQIEDNLTSYNTIKVLQRHHSQMTIS